MFFFLMIRRPPRSTLDRSSAASDVYKRQVMGGMINSVGDIDYFTFIMPSYMHGMLLLDIEAQSIGSSLDSVVCLSLIHISEPTRPY